MSSHASLGAASDDRKARLAKLKSLKRKEPEPDHHADEEYSSTLTTTSQPQDATTVSSTSPPTADVASLHLSGRNYDAAVRGPKLGFEQAPVGEGPTLEDQAAELEDEVRRRAAEEEAAGGDRGIDLFKLQPKKPNWDLKRELNRKLEVLNVRTDNAVARLVRERLEAKKAAAGKKTGGHGDEGKEEDGLEGTALVEGLRMREREEAEEERREREDGEDV